MKQLQCTAEMRDKISKISLNPHWIAGLTAGEGCFSRGLSPDSAYKLGYRVKFKLNKTSNFNFSIGLTATNQEI